MKGYQVICGTKGIGGFFAYFRTKKEAVKWGKAALKTDIAKCHKGKAESWIETKELRECKTCKKLTEDIYCLRCEDLMQEAREIRVEVD